MHRGIGRTLRHSVLERCACRRFAMAFVLRSVAGRRTLPTCMASPLRVARVSRQINREVSELLSTDKVDMGGVRLLLKDYHGAGDVGRSDGHRDRFGTG